ncbi:MAG: DUF2207 domain-containing protein, partial [Leucobacter sp.]|nr:DUF2207 domain-containing protein [Leucobacter sp.]
MLRKKLWLTIVVSLWAVMMGAVMSISAGGPTYAQAHALAAPHTALQAAPEAAKAAQAAPASHMPASLASVDDFEFESFDAEYTLGRDAEGRSTLATVETLVAIFPETDQNRGIRRLLPERYQGHPTDLAVTSVTDGRGNDLPYEEDSDDDIRILTIAGDDYVHGPTTYVIEYEQRNVTAHFADTGRDEFYWDVNGLDWSQPFANVTATVHLADGVSAGLTAHMSAVQGTKNTTRPAAITASADGRSIAVESAGSLAPHQTLTFAIGFERGTFAERDDGFFAAPAPTISAVAALVSAGSVVWAALVRRRHLRDAPGRGIIVPQYEPLEGVSVLTAAHVLGDHSGRAVPAQIIDLAVRGHVRLLDRGATDRGATDHGATAHGSTDHGAADHGAAAHGARETTTGEGSASYDGAVKRPRKSRRSGYVIELLSPTAIHDEHEYKLVKALFGHDPQPGAIRDLTKPDAATTKAFEALQKRVASDALEHELRKPYPSRPVTWLVVVAAVAALAGVIFGAFALEEALGGFVPIVTLFGSIVGLVVAIVLISRRPLAERGVELRDHLRGQKMYIKLAEADRLRYLQSPLGAPREGAGVLGAGYQRDGAADTTRVVHLYERLLPYAML